MTERLSNNLENRSEAERTPTLSSLNFKKSANFLNVSFIIDGEEHERSIEISEEDKKEKRSFWEIFLNFLNVEKNTPLTELPKILKKLTEDEEHSKENV